MDGHTNPIWVRSGCVEALHPACLAEGVLGLVRVKSVTREVVLSLYAGTGKW